MIEIKNVVKKIKNTIVLNNVSLSINAGDRIALIGANGAGKTTLIETILGISKPNSGKIIISFKYDKSPLEKIGIQFQDALYPPDVAVNEIIEFFINVSTTKINHKAFKEMIDIFEMKEFINKKANGLSGGQKQKLNVFLTLLSDPSIILLDELTTGLDIKAQKSITNFIYNYLNDNQKTMIIVSHNPTEINKLCNRVVIMKQGKIVYDKSANQAIKEFKSIDKLMNSFI